MLRNALPEMITKKLPGPKAAAIISRRADAVPTAVKCTYPIVIARGEGAMIEDVDGNRFVDWVGGVGVLNIGYSHPEVVEVVKAQTEKYFHGMFNIVTHEGYVALAEKLNGCTPVAGEKKKTYFANSGAEAVENAVKFAKAYTKRPNVIAFSGAFHGRTLLAMTLTSKKAYAAGMGPFPDGVYRAEFPYLYRKPVGISAEDTISYYISKLEEVFEQCSPANYVAAMVVEPVQGEGGFIPAPVEWIKAVRGICDKYGILLIADEVQTGFCRTGRLFASEYWSDAGYSGDSKINCCRNSAQCCRCQGGNYGICTCRNHRWYLLRQSPGLCGRPEGYGNHGAGQPCRPGSGNWKNRIRQISFMERKIQCRW